MMDQSYQGNETKDEYSKRYLNFISKSLKTLGNSTEMLLDFQLFISPFSLISFFRKLVLLNLRNTFDKFSKLVSAQ